MNIVYNRTSLPDNLEIWTYLILGNKICLGVFATAIFQIFKVFLSMRLGYNSGFGLIAFCAILAMLALNADRTRLLHSEVSRSFGFSKVVLVIVFWVDHVLAHLHLSAAQAR